MIIAESRGDVPQRDPRTVNEEGVPTAMGSKYDASRIKTMVNSHTPRALTV